MNNLQKENSLKFFEELKALCLKHGMYKCGATFTPFAEGIEGGNAGGPEVTVSLCRRWPDPRCMTRLFFDENPFMEMLYIDKKEQEILVDNP